MKSVYINDNLTVFYPLELKPRKQQFDAIQFTREAINQKKKFVLLDLPPGGGKSYFGIPMFANWYKNNININAKFDVLTNSKILQEQYIKDFSYVKNLKGKSNYWCEQYNTDCEKGEDICKASKKSCFSCPYKQALGDWTLSDISITNFHMFNTLSVFVPKRLRERNANVLIVDEAHDFEDVFCDYLTAKINARMLKKFGLSDTEVRQIDDRLYRIKTIQQYVGFIENFLIDRLNTLKSHYQATLSNDKSSLKKKKEVSSWLKTVDSNLKKFENFLNDYNREKEDGETNDPKENWVLDIVKNDKEAMYSGVELVSQPVWGYSYLKRYIWDFYDHVIFMSGTLLDKNLITYLNGFDEELTAYKQFGSVFPISRRPIYYIKAGKMTYSDKIKTFQEQKKWLSKILKKNEKRKGILHTNTYEVAEWIKAQTKSNRFLFHSSDDRDEILRLHINTDDPTILVSPSMTNGVDLKGDLSRFQAILKIPYPNISSNKVKQRQKTNKAWYNWKTVVDFIQAYGRSIRSRDDWAETYVLDSSFSNIMTQPIMPRYITDAIKILKT